MLLRLPTLTWSSSTKPSSLFPWLARRACDRMNTMRWTRNQKNCVLAYRLLFIISCRTYSRSYFCVTLVCVLFVIFFFFFLLYFFLFFLSFYQHYVLRACVCVCVWEWNGWRQEHRDNALLGCLSFFHVAFIFILISRFFLFSAARRFDDAWCFSLHGFFCHSIQWWFFSPSFSRCGRAQNYIFLRFFFIVWLCARVRIVNHTYGVGCWNTDGMDAFTNSPW